MNEYIIECMKAVETYLTEKVFPIYSFKLPETFLLCQMINPLSWTTIFFTMSIKAI